MLGVVEELLTISQVELFVGYVVGSVNEKFLKARYAIKAPTRVGVP